MLKKTALFLHDGFPNGDGQDGAGDDDKCYGLGHPHPTRWPWGQRGAGTGIN